MEESFAALGTAGAIKKLYEGTGFSPCRNPRFEGSAGHFVTASSVLLEGIDFNLAYFPFKHLGYKVVLAATGELFASLATPVVLKLTFGVSAKLDFPEVKELWEGAVSAASEFGYKDVGLEILPSLTGLSLSVAATGTCASDVMAGRPIAKSKDLICISDNPGAAFLGERLLDKGKDLPGEERDALLGKYPQLLRSYLKPELPPQTVSQLLESGIVPSFGFFCREPLSVQLRTLCSQSGLGAKIYADKIPFAGGSIDAAASLGLDPLQAALKGGDDYCLLFTVSIGDYERFLHDFQSWEVIGHLARPEVGIVIVSPDGLEHTL